jgi:catechol 2,3-dioxygenase-like lactoylglutathione lyase family enzyme
LSGMPVNVTCFSHLGITASDLDASIDFYTRVLGFVRLFEDAHEEWRRVGLGIGDIQLELFSPHLGRVAGQAVDPFYVSDYGRPKIALTVADVEETYERLQDAGIVALCPIVTTAVSRFFFIADPDGTPIQLHEFSGGRQRVTELFT